MNSSMVYFKQMVLIAYRPGNIMIRIFHPVHGISFEVNFKLTHMTLPLLEFFFRLEVS